MQRFATLVVRNTTTRPVVVYADWTEKIGYIGNNRGSLENVVLHFRDEHTKEEEEDYRITIPRRIESIEIDSCGDVVLSAKDKLEVEKQLVVQSSNNVHAKCSIRANTIQFTSNKGNVKVDNAIEAVLVSLNASMDIKATKRVSAVSELLVECGRDVEISSLYCLYNPSTSIESRSGNVKLGSVHGENIAATAREGNVSVGSLSGSCVITAPTGKVNVHFDASTQQSVMSTVVSGKHSEVSLAPDALPMQVWGAHADDSLTAQLTQHEDSSFTLAGAATENTDNKPASKLRIQSTDKSTVKLESWITNVLKNMQK